jgi:hypothetical protein
MDLPTSRTIHVRSGTTKTAQQELIVRLFQPYGHVHTRLGTHGETQIECHLDMSFEFLMDKRDRVPKWVMEADACFWAYLAGYMDAEAHIGLRRTKYGRAAVVEIGSCDVGILRGLWRGLNARGVQCPQIRLKTLAGTPIGQGYRTNRDFYRLFISRKASLDKLFRSVDSYLKHADRRKRMEKAWANVLERGIP